MALRAVLLDAGGTLFHRVPSTEAVVLAALAKHGVAAPRERVHEAFHRAIHAERVPARGEEAETWRRFNEDLLADLGIAPDPAMVDDVARALEDGERRAYPDAVPLLAALRERGLRRVVVSNFTHALPRILRDTGLSAHVDDVVYSWEAGFAKPDPRIYAAALDRAQASPAEVLMVGDSLDHDVRGPAALGIRGVLLDRSTRPAPPGIARIRDLREVLHLLDGQGEQAGRPSPKP